MEEKPMDRRVRKTKRQLRLALMQLMSEKSVKDISVRELAAIADINRGTFYIHYKDVYDLLTHLEDEVRVGNEVNSCPCYPCDADTVGRTDIEALEFFTGDG